MTCIPSSNKCEWENIIHFITLFNKKHNVNYIRTACLDLQSSVKQPEVLCTDENTGNTLVIERKILIWPLNYVQKHKSEHFYWNTVIQELGKINLCKLPYSVYLNQPLTDNEYKLKNIAKEIANVIKKNIDDLYCKGFIKSDIPEIFTIRIENPNERDYGEPEYGIVIRSQEDISEIADSNNLPVEFKNKIIDYFISCEKKFLNYDESIKILILDTPIFSLYGLSIEWWNNFFSHTNPPKCIDEIWLSCSDEAEWYHSKIYPFEPVNYPNFQIFENLSEEDRIAYQKLCESSRF